MARPATKDATAPEKKLARFWHNELKSAETREKKWRERAQKVIERYRDERESGSDRRTNILWSNTEVLKSVLFQGIGNPDVRRRFPKKGKEEKAARQAALVLEHSLAYSADTYDCAAQIEAAVEDMLLPGRGQCWVVYDAEVANEAPDPEGDTKEDDSESETAPTPETQDEITEQSVRIEHVYWEDYRTSAGRKETDIWWKARRHQYSKNDLKQYFPDDAEHIPLTAEVVDRADQGGEEEDSYKRANVWEIWNKVKKTRLYVAEDYKYVLREDEDPYELRDFFPCPRPIYSVKTTSSLIPIPEFTLYQDQADELDQVTTRLNRMIDALKRRGVYDASLEGPDNQLSNLASADDNQFIPYKGFPALMEKGGLKGVFQTEDLNPAIAVVNSLFQQRGVLVQTIYEVTGISDVIRGASNPNETATAQRIKGQFGSLRIQKRQGEVQRFIRDCYRLKAEILAEHFQREKLVDMSGIEMPTQIEIMQARQKLQMIQMAQQQAQQQQAMAAQQAQGQPPGQPAPMPPMIQNAPVPDPDMIRTLTETAKAVSWEDISTILRSDDKRGYKVDIETEQTAAADEMAEKEARIEFLTTMQGFMERVLPAAQAMPQIAPLAKELVIFALKSFKVGRVLEETFDDVFDKMAEEASHPKPPQVNPADAAKAKQIETQTQLAVEKARGQAQATQVKMQSDQMRAQADMAKRQMEMKAMQDGQDYERMIREQELADRNDQRQYDMAERVIEMKSAQDAAAIDRQHGVMDLRERRAKIANDIAAYREAQMNGGE